MTSLRFWFPVLLGVVAVPVCFVVGIYLCASIKSIYPLVLLFPYWALLGPLVDDRHWAASVVILLAIALPYPLYGIAIGIVRVRGHAGGLTVALALAHMILTVIAVAVGRRLGLQ